MGDRAAAIGSVLRSAILALPNDVAIAVLAAGAVVAFLAAARRVPLNSAFSRQPSARKREHDPAPESRRPPLPLGLPNRSAKGTRQA